MFPEYINYLILSTEILALKIDRNKVPEFMPVYARQVILTPILAW